MKLKIFTIMIAALSISHNAIAQPATVPVNLPQMVPPTPEAANLIRNIQYPVSYAHGSVDIRIPLYEITVGDVTIPISISYNHKGLRPLEFTHYLGQGWSLNAEPSIARKPNGQPDRNFKYVIPPLQYSWGYWNQLLIGNVDAYPDEYYYNIPGKSGAFVFKHPAPDSGVATTPFEAIRVENPSGECLTITDDDGSIYSFGLRDCGSPDKPSLSWKCTEITTPRGNVTFNYITDIQVLHRSLTEFAIIDQLFVEKPTYTDWPEKYETLPSVFRKDSPPYGEKTANEYHLVKKGNEGELQWWEFEIKKDFNGSLGGIKEEHHDLHRISEIKFPGGKVVFIRTQPSPLSYIVVYNNIGEPIRTITFTHTTSLQEFAGGGSVGGGSDYPILKSVSISGGGLDEEYNFEYYWSGTSYNYNFPCLDQYAAAGPSLNFWGYWTAGAGEEPAGYVHRDWHSVNFYKGTGALFTDPYYFSVGSGNRLGKVYKGGILRTITTKSGSQTTFDYESDKFKKEQMYSENGNKLLVDVESGGLRIKTIIQHDGDPAKAVERHFEYGELEQVFENGNRIYKPSGVGYTSEWLTPDLFTSSYLYYDQAHEVNWGRRIISCNLHGDITSSGVPIVYSRVTEYTKGYVEGRLQDFGKTVRHYNYSQPGTLTSIIPGTSLACDDLFKCWNKDYLKTEITYRYDGGEHWTKLQSTNYRYSGYAQDGIEGYHVWKTKDYMDDLYPYDLALYPRMMSPGSQRLNVKIDSLFTDNGVIVSQIKYTYNDSEKHKETLAHLYPLSVTTTRSDGTEQTHSFRYVQDATGITNSEHSAAIGVMKAKNIVRPVIEQVDMAGTEALRTTYNLYTSNSGVISTGWPSQRKLEIKDGSMSAPEERIVFHKYDSKGNPVCATKDGITKVVYLWGYGRQYLVAVIENATYDQVKSALGNVGPETISIEGSNFDSVMNSLRASTHMGTAFITTFKHRPMVGIVEIKDPRGVAVSYEYDSVGRLGTISDENNNPLNRYQYNIK